MLHLKECGRFQDNLRLIANHLQYNMKGDVLYDVCETVSDLTI